MARKAATETKTEQDAPAEHETRGDVAIFQPARLPYHPAIEDRFQVDKGQWKVLVEAIFPSAKTADAIVMALSYCQSRKLDVMKRPVHIVPMWDSARGGYVETVWPGISELRTTASRTQGYAGVDEAEFGPTRKVKFTGRVKDRGDWKDQTIEIEFPDWCRLTVYRIVDGQRCKFVGPKVKWEETYATLGNSDIPNKMWQERPEGQIEKCAEAAALRRAFPEELGNELTAEEMAGRGLHDTGITVEAVAEPAGTPSGAPHQDAGQVGRRDTAPPRGVTAPKKDDPISTGPLRAEPPKEPAKEPAPEQPDQQPRSDTDPHQIPGKGESFETWTAKYVELIKTSPDLPTAYGWIKKNQQPLERLEKGSPSHFQKCRKAAEQTIEALRDAAAKAAKAKPPKKAAEMDDSGQMDEAAPANPEGVLKRVDAELAAVEDPGELQNVWEQACEPLIADLFPPDQDEAQAIYRRHEKRLGGD